MTRELARRSIHGVLVAAAGVCAFAGTLTAQSDTTHATVVGANVTKAGIELLHVLSPDAQLKNGWRALYAAALSDDGEVVTSAHTQPGALLSKFGADGKPRWSRSLPTASVTSLSFAGDTLALVEQEDESALVLIASSTGVEIKRYALPKQSFESANVLGRYDGAWYIQVQRNLGAYSDVSLPYRVLRRLDATTGTWDDVYTHIDSTPRASAGNRLDAIPTPFAPAPSFALSQSHGPLFSSGTNWDVHTVRQNGALHSLFRLVPLSTQLDDSTYNRVAAEWMANPPLNMIVPEGTYEKAAELGRATHGRMLASLTATADGALIVRRRDADSSASSARRPTVWDLIPAGSDTVQRLLLDANVNIVRFAANRRLLVARMESDGSRSLQVVRIVRVPDTP